MAEKRVEKRLTFNIVDFPESPEPNSSTLSPGSVPTLEVRVMGTHLDLLFELGLGLDEW